MTEPNIEQTGEPEKVDNTNALHRALVERLISETGTDVSTVVEQMAADGRLAADEVTAAAAKGWIAEQAADAVIVAIEARRDDRDVKPIEVVKPAAKG